jgi:hypothetical protein
MQGDTIVAFVPSTMTRGQALAGLAQGATTLDLDPATFSQLASGTNIKLRTGRYSFSQLVAWTEGKAVAIRRIPGVIGIDANEGTNRITFFVRNESLVPAIYAEARRVGLPDDVIEISKAHFSFASSDLSLMYRPTGGGIEINNGSEYNGGTCTLGLNVTLPSGVKGFYTASHCATPDNFGAGLTGAPIWQPYKDAVGQGGPLIGHIAINPAWNATDTMCTAGLPCAHVDAMFVSYDNPAVWSGQIASMNTLATLNAGSLYLGQFTGFFSNVNVNPSAADYWEGRSVDKIGRTTGWTRGVIEHTCTHVDADNEENGNPTQTATLLCQQVVKGAYAGNGDSGSPVFASNGLNGTTPAKALGILSSVDYTHGNDLTGEGALFCNNSDCRYLYSSLIRIRLYVYETY